MSPLDETKPGNPFVFLPFLSALCDTVMDSSRRAYLCLFLSPSLPSDLIRGQWAGKKRVVVGGFSHPLGGGGVKGESELGGCMWGASHNSVSSPADKPDHCGNNRTIIGCAYSCTQRNGTNEALTRASANDQICPVEIQIKCPRSPASPHSGWVNSLMRLREAAACC